MGWRRDVMYTLNTTDEHGVAMVISYAIDHVVTGGG